MRGRKPRKQPPSPRNMRALFRDVDNLAEVVADTIVRLDREGRGDIARPLEAALVKLAG